MLILIPCSGQKQPDGVPRQRQLSFTKTLGYYRDALIKSLVANTQLWVFKLSNRDQRAPLANQGLHSRNNGEVLPALQRYQGTLYEQAADALYNAPVPVLIVSALFGIIELEDEIPCYDLMMTDVCHDPTCLGAFELSCRKKASVGALWSSVFGRDNCSVLQGQADALAFLSDPYMRPARKLINGRVCTRLNAKVVNGNSHDTPELHGQFLSDGLSHGYTRIADWQGLSNQTKWKNLIKLVE